MTSPRPAPTLDYVRSQFPALERRHNGAPVAYFDGPGGTQVPRAVGAAMTEYLFHHNANTHWAYPTSIETDAALDEARGALADFVGGRPSEIAFGANMTTLAFHLGRALGLAVDLGTGDVVDHAGRGGEDDTPRGLAGAIREGTREEGLAGAGAPKNSGLMPLSRNARSWSAR